MIKKEKMEVAVDIGSKCSWNHISFLVKKKKHAPTYILFGGKFIFLIREQLLYNLRCMKKFHKANSLTHRWKYVRCWQTEKISGENDRGLDITSSHFCRLVDSDTFWRGSCSEIRPTPSQKLQRVMRAMFTWIRRYNAQCTHEKHCFCLKLTINKTF